MRASRSAAGQTLDSKDGEGKELMTSY
jgi:hypothetical protein